MTTRTFLAAVLGGIVMFIWNFIGHDLLPLGHTGIHEMPNESGVLDAMKSGIGDKPGLYHFPGFGFGDNPTREQKEQGMKELPAKLAANPSGLLIYYPPGRTFSFGRLLGVEFAAEFLEVLLIVFLLSQTQRENFGCRVVFFLVAGILAAITTNVSYWNWDGFPADYTVAYMSIQVIGFLCAGIVAALVMGKRTA